MSATKVLNLSKISVQPMRRPKHLSRPLSESSVESEKLSDSEYKKWQLLNEELMKINDKNYAKYSTALISKLVNIIQGGKCSQKLTVAVLYILYERSMHDLLTKSFPVSANIMDTLTTSCSDSVFETVQPLIQEHLKRLQNKLRGVAALCGTDIGVICLLLSMYKLNKMVTRDTKPIEIVIEQIIIDMAEYVDSLGSDVSILTDVFMLLSYGLIWYSLYSEYINEHVILIQKFVRKIFVTDLASITKFGKVLALDILEQVHNKDKTVHLYSAIYKKIVKSGTYILDGIEEFLREVACPLGNDNAVDNNVFGDEAPPTRRTSTPSTDEESGVDSVVQEKKQPLSLCSTDLLLEEKEHTPGKPSWSRRISEIQATPRTEKTSSKKILVPERCIGRVVGYEGAIIRKLEIQTNTTIIVNCKEVPERFDTTCLTAHRLVTGALGLKCQLDEGKVIEENKKISDAKVKKQTAIKEERMRELSLQGLDEDIEKAERMINDIITCIVTINIPLEFTVDEILDRFSNKLKTIEALLNVYMEIEEQEDDKVVIAISGDEKSCKDGKKLIFEEVGSFRSQHGHFFHIPSEMMLCLQDMEGISKFASLVQSIAGGRVINVKSKNGYAVFISGFPYQVTKSLQIFQKTNIEILWCLSEATDRSTKYTVQELCNYAKECFADNNNKSWRASPTLARKGVAVKVREEKKRLVYTRDNLLAHARCLISKIFPPCLDAVLQTDPAAASIILEEGMKPSMFEEVLMSLSSPMLSGYDVQHRY